MKIDDQSDTKLAFSIGIPYFNWTHCELDRTTGRARIKRVMLFWPLKTIDVPLSDIVSVTLAVASGSAGEAGSYTKLYPQVILRSGRRIAFSAFREASSKKAVAAMQVFLSLEPKP